VATIKDLTATVKLGTGDSPLFDTELAVDMTAIIPTTQPAAAEIQTAPRLAASRIELVRCDGDLARLQSALGPLLPLFVPAPPPTSAAATQPSAITLIAQNAIVVSSGKLSASMLGSFDGTTFTITKPLTVTVSDLTLQQSGAGGNSTPINNQSLSTQIGGSIALADGGLHMNLHTLSLDVGNELSIRADPQAPVDVALSSGGALTARGTVKLTNANLPELLAMGAPFLPPQQAANLGKLSSGQASGTIQFQPSPGGGTTASVDLNVIDVTVANYLTNEKIQLTLGGELTSDQTALHDATVNLNTSFGKISVSNGQFVLASREGNRNAPVGVFDMVQSVNIQASDVNLAKLYGLENLVQPSAGAMPAAATIPPAGATAPVPPMEVLGGMATIDASISRQGDTTTANVSKFQVANLTVRRGSEIFNWPRDVSMQLAAAVQTQSGSSQGASILKQLATVTVKTFALDTGVSKITLAKDSPVVLRNLGDPSQAGIAAGIVIDGDLEPLERLTEVTAGLPANTYPFKGHNHAEEFLQKEAGESLVKVSGSWDITNFKVLGPAPAGAARPAGAGTASDTVVFSENDIAIQNGCNIDLNTYSFAIDPAKPVTITLKSSGALGLSIEGGVTDLLHQRQINGIAIQLDYDLAKLWPIVKPLLPPSQQQTLADLVITGKHQRTLKLSGSLPTDKPFNQAITSLVAGGYFTVDSLSTHGISIGNLDLALYVKDGIARTVYPDQPEGQNATKPASCNGGTLDIGVMALDLGSDPMILTMPTVNPTNPHYLLRNVQLTPALAKTLFVGILNNPLFVDSSKSDGLVSVWVSQLQNVPLGALLNQQSPNNKGIAEVHDSISQLYLASPVLAVLAGGQALTAEIKDGVVHVAGGKLTEDTTLTINQTKPLRVWGTVILANQTFAPMTVSIPPSLLPQQVLPQKYLAFMPDTIEIPMEGDMSHPKVMLDKMLPKLIADATKKMLLNGVLGGGNQNNGGGQSPLDGLFKGLGHH
jgi:hypothetical protein